MVQALLFGRMLNIQMPLTHPTLTLAADTLNSLSESLLPTFLVFDIFFRRHSAQLADAFHHIQRPKARPTARMITAGSLDSNQILTITPTMSPWRLKRIHGTITRIAVKYGQRTKYLIEGSCSLWSSRKQPEDTERVSWRKRWQRNRYTFN